MTRRVPTWIVDPVLSLACALVSAVLAACGDDVPTQAKVDAGSAADAGCAPGSAPGSMGDACVPAGIPATSCAAGFVEDGASGCEPVLPPAPCADGTMATPGEDVCRPVAPCGAGPWGDVASRANVHVDASYAGPSSDGSMSKPWKTIQQAVDAAAPGSVVAIAEGSYVENVDIDGKGVTLWGACPERTEIVGSAAGLSAILVRGGAAGTEIHDLAVRGDGLGVAVSDALDVVLARVWIHDTAGRGLDVEDVLGPSSLSATGVLLERTGDIAVFVLGAPLAMAASVARDTQPGPNGLTGRGVVVQDNQKRGTLTMTSCVVERSRDDGVFVGGSDATIEASAVLGTLPRAADGAEGRGLEASDNPKTGERSIAVVRGSVLADNGKVSVFVHGSDLEMETTTIRDTRTEQATGRGGRGIEASADASDVPTTSLVLRSSKVARSRELGIFVAGAEATIESTLVTDTRAGDASPGFGIGIAAVEAGGRRSTAALRWSEVDASLQAGVLVTASDAVIDSSWIHDTHDAAGTLGDGVTIAAMNGDASATLTRCLLERSDRAGVASFGGKATVVATRLECNAIDLDGETFEGRSSEFGDEGGNVCGCQDDTRPCKVLSSSLSPPVPIAP